MGEEITLEDIREAMRIVDENTWHCPKCGTKKDYIVLGITEIDFIPQFCKCEAERLGKTPFVQNQAKMINKD